MQCRHLREDLGCGTADKSAVSGSIAIVKRAKTSILGGEVFDFRRCARNSITHNAGEMRSFWTAFWTVSEKRSAPTWMRPDQTSPQILKQ
jgi:hypothetical protein